MVRVKTLCLLLLSIIVASMLTHSASAFGLTIHKPSILKSVDCAEIGCVHQVLTEAERQRKLKAVQREIQRRQRAAERELRKRQQAQRDAERRKQQAIARQQERERQRRIQEVQREIERREQQQAKAAERDRQRKLSVVRKELAKRQQQEKERQLRAAERELAKRRQQEAERQRQAQQRIEQLNQREREKLLRDAQREIAKRQQQEKERQLRAAERELAKRHQQEAERQRQAQKRIEQLNQKQRERLLRDAQRELAKRQQQEQKRQAQQRIEQLSQREREELLRDAQREIAKRQRGAHKPNNDASNKTQRQLRELQEKERLRKLSAARKELAKRQRDLEAAKRAQQTDKNIAGSRKRLEQLARQAQQELANGQNAKAHETLRKAKREKQRIIDLRNRNRELEHQQRLIQQALQQQDQTKNRQQTVNRLRSANQKFREQSRNAQIAEAQRELENSNKSVRKYATAYINATRSGDKEAAKAAHAKYLEAKNRKDALEQLNRTLQSGKKIRPIADPDTQVAKVPDSENSGGQTGQSLRILNQPTTSNEKRRTTSSNSPSSIWRPVPGKQGVEYIVDPTDGKVIYRANEFASRKDKALIQLRNLAPGYVELSNDMAERGKGVSKSAAHGLATLGNQVQRGAQSLYDPNAAAKAEQRQQTIDQYLKPSGKLQEQGEVLGYALPAGGAAKGASALTRLRQFIKPSARSIAARTINLNPRQIQKKYNDHAFQFGIHGNYNSGNAQKFASAIAKHVKSQSTREIAGTFRKQPVIHYINPTTGLNVMTDRSGNYISGWQLSPSQVENVVKRGSL